MNSERKINLRICLLLFFGFACLAYLFPYTGDDWAWGSSIGLDRLKIFFRDYNGRYAGNLAVLLLTRSKLVDILVMAASFVALCFLSYLYTAERTNASVLLSAVLLFLMPKEMWAQVMVWTSGFANYVLSTVITVGYLVFSRGITGAALPSEKHSWSRCFWFLLLGFVSALFVESITVFNICLSLAIIIWIFLKSRKFHSSHMGFLCGLVIGTCAMFSNGAYDRIAQGEDYYRHRPFGLRDTVYFAVDQAGELLEYILYHNLVFCVIVTTLLAALAVWCIRKTARKKTAVFSLIIHICSFLLLWKKTVVYQTLTAKIALKPLVAGMIPVMIALLYVCSILVMVCTFVEKGRRFHMLLPLYCAVVSLAPLVVVSPIGPRCVFIGYMFMIVFTVDLFSYIRNKAVPGERWMGKVFGLVAAAQLVFYLTLFYPIHHYDLLRLDFIRQQAAEGGKKVLISDLPNSDYLWNSTPIEGNLPERYKLFYGLDAELEFDYISYTELEDIINGNS